MPSISVSKHVAAAPRRVFEVFTDLAHVAERVSAITGIELLSEGPVGVGTRFCETRTLMGSGHRQELEIRAFEPITSYVVGCESFDCDITTRFTFSAVGDGTEVVVELDARPLTAMAKLLAPIEFMSGKLESCLVQDLDDLAAFAEGNATT